MDWSDLLNVDEYLKLVIGLLALTDPLGVLPVLFGMLDGQSESDKRRAIRTSIITFVVTLVLFTLFGVTILNTFGISIAALKVAGGVLFLLYALEMIGLIKLPSMEFGNSEMNAGLMGLVPIGIPLLAGPGTISTVIIFADLHDGLTHTLLVIAVIISVAIITGLVFTLGQVFNQQAGKTTVLVLSRIMGLLLAAIAIEFILDGIALHFPGISSIHG